MGSKEGDLNNIFPEGSERNPKEEREMGIFFEKHYILAKRSKLAFIVKRNATLIDLFRLVVWVVNLLNWPLLPRRTSLVAAHFGTNCPSEQKIASLFGWPKKKIGFPVYE